MGIVGVFLDPLMSPRRIIVSAVKETVYQVKAHPRKGICGEGKWHDEPDIAGSGRIDESM
jgi:hypothetical protein